MGKVAVQRVDGDFRRRLAAAFNWQTDRGERGMYADLTGWWRDPDLIRELGPALGSLYDGSPTVVLGPVSRGALVGALTAAALGVGFVEVRKEIAQASDSDRWVKRTTGPDYRDRHVVFGFRRDLVRAGDRVLMVDDWADTGATARVVRALVDDCGAHWIGAACIVDGLTDPRLRRDLPLRALLDLRSLRSTPYVRRTEGQAPRLFGRKGEGRSGACGAELARGGGAERAGRGGVGVVPGS
ncbi:MAG TPA: phosphoribosyltransferase family protein [Kribbella sp.]|uniref:phosphoribosyltransferase family protein n=1 Tax=Kribbella sp. TaxID=1871183 RepID=UPI002D768D22|nr:phosphoribosyltransferase family protein [Kribbella sp.]HET6292417.1 phosphoribosyltransferase family protein [Kribbella sp.]